jgi:hypothetical protein
LIVLEAERPSVVTATKFSMKSSPPSASVLKLQVNVIHKKVEMERERIYLAV